MNTPICDFVSAYARGSACRLHMPGHKGKGDMGIEPLDITEIEGADLLYSADGIIAESEANARLLFDSGKTVYSTEGSSLSIRTMLYLAYLWGKTEDKDQTVLAGRNAHRAFHSAAALLDLDVIWLYGKNDSLMSCSITPESLEKALSECHSKPFAVYLTSPDYLGNILNIKELAAVCEAYGILCLVDNAHGAYLRFLSPSQHPINLGAHMCADSTHKTLSALTGAAYLHISKTAPEMLFSQAENAMALFASTSPSYLILQSLDKVNKYLSDGYADNLKELAERLFSLGKELASMGYATIGDEPLKLTLDAREYGYTGTDLSRILAKENIICEHADRDVLVLMLTPETEPWEITRLEAVLKAIPKRSSVKEPHPALPEGNRVMSIRDAAFSTKRQVPLSDALGKILADSTVSCPPAIPIAVCGERIDEAVLRLFEYYGIDSVWIID